jgi:thiamine biosynthesis lipoprotein
VQSPRALPSNSDSTATAVDQLDAVQGTGCACAVGGFEAMRTRFEVVLPLCSGQSESALRGVIDLVRDEVLACEARISTFQRGSMTAKLHAYAAAGPVTLDSLTFDLLRTCREVWEQSGGAFDITLGPLLEAWGMRGESPATLSDAESRADRAIFGMNYITFDSSQRNVTIDPRVADSLRLDLGAVGKGHALDLAAAALRDEGITCGLLHAGTSSVLALGAPPGRDGWRIALAGPKGVTFPYVTLRDSALGVSGGHGRQVMLEGQVVGHIIDPRTRRPAQGNLLAAVMSDSATLADAWSTALLVDSQVTWAARTGVSSAQELSGQFPSTLRGALVVASPGGQASEPEGSEVRILHQLPGVLGWGPA